MLLSSRPTFLLLDLLRKPLQRNGDKNLGISVSADGSEDDDIHIQGLEDYVFNQSDLASPEDHFASDSEEAQTSQPPGSLYSESNRFPQ